MRSLSTTLLVSLNSVTLVTLFSFSTAAAVFTGFVIAAAVTLAEAIWSRQ
jgi:hypothetical protein